MKRLLLAVLMTLVMANPAAAITSVWSGAYSGEGDVTVSAPIADNAIVRGDGGASGVQSSGITIDDNDLMTVPSTAGAGVLLPLEDDAVTPTMGFGDGGDGLFSHADGGLKVSLNGVAYWRFLSGSFVDAAIGGAGLLAEVSSAINPNLVSNYNDPDTGIGSADANIGSLIAGAVNVANWTTTGFGVGVVSPVTTLDVNGGVALDISTPDLSGNAYTMLLTDHTILINDDDVDVTGTVVVALPLASTATGVIYWIKKIGSSQIVQLDANGAELIDGVATKDITTQWGGFLLQCNGTTWSIF